MKNTTYHITVVDRDGGEKVEMDANAVLIGASTPNNSNRGLYYVSNTCANADEEVLNMIQGVFYALNEKMRTVDTLTAAYLMALVHEAAAGEGFDVNPLDDDGDGYGYDDDDESEHDGGAE